MELRGLVLCLLLWCPFSSSAQKVFLNEYPSKEIYYYVGPNKPTHTFSARQIAQRFECTNSGLLETVQIYRMILNSTGVGFEEFSHTKFKIRVYLQDRQTGGPGKDIAQDTVIVEDKASRKIEVDMKPYAIQVEKGAFFVGIEFIKERYNERFTKVDRNKQIHINTIPHRYKYISSYQPFVGMSPIKGPVLNTWIQNDHGIWEIYDYFSEDFTDFAITAVLNTAS